MEFETITLADRMAGGSASKVVGLYQMFLRRNLEHFFPDSTLDLAGDRSLILVEGLPREERGAGPRRGGPRATCWREDDRAGGGVRAAARA